MRQILAHTYEGRHVALVNAPGGLAEWIAALLGTLGAEVRTLDAPEGLPSPDALLAFLRKGDAVIFPALPTADTSEAMCALLYRLSACLSVARAAQADAVLLCMDDAAYRDAHAPWGCREDDPLGGRDAAGLTAACARLQAEGFRLGYCGEALPVVVAHYGALLYGGMPGHTDVACWLTALLCGASPTSRNPGTARAYQHAIEPLIGALSALGRALSLPSHHGDTWNFGAPPECWLTERRALSVLAQHCDGELGAMPLDSAPPIRTPRLDSTRARQQLGWRTVYDAEESLALLADWQALAQQHGDTDARRMQIAAYWERLERLAD